MNAIGGIEPHQTKSRHYNAIQFLQLVIQHLTTTAKRLTSIPTQNEFRKTRIHYATGELGLALAGAPGVVKQNSSRASVTTPMNSGPPTELASVGERPKPLDAEMRAHDKTS